MPLRLAGETVVPVQGADGQGWLREIAAKDALPGLKIDQQGTGRVFDFQDGGVSKLYLPDGGSVSIVGGLVFDLANDVTLSPANPSSPRTLTIPDPGGDDAFAFLGAAQTLTNKTLASPVIQGSVGIGTTMPLALLDIQGSAESLHLSRADGANPNAPNVRIKKARGTIASKTIVADADFIGHVSWEGYDGAAFIEGAEIRGIVNGTPALNNMPTELAFRTNSGGAATVERMRLDKNGNLAFQQASTISTSAGDLSFNPAGRVLMTPGDKLEVRRADGGVGLRIADTNGNSRLEVSAVAGADPEVVVSSANNCDLVLEPKNAESAFVVLRSTKASAGDPTAKEGMVYINSADNAIRMYADGAWRTLASW